MNHASEKNLSIEQIIVGKNGSPKCNGCGKEIAWEIKDCDNCRCAFGSLAKGNDGKEASSLPDVAINDGSLANADSHTIQCEVCERWNPGGTIQCMQCTAFLPEEVV